MIELTGKQKRFLRGRGQALPARVQMGKAGLSDALVRQLGQALSRHELVKVHLPAGPRGDRRAAAAGLAQAAQAVCVGLVGRTAVLYRPDPGLPEDRRISLP